TGIENFQGFDMLVYLPVADPKALLAAPDDVYVGLVGRCFHLPGIQGQREVATASQRVELLAPRAKRQLPGQFDEGSPHRVAMAMHATEHLVPVLRGGCHGFSPLPTIPST